MMATRARIKFARALSATVVQTIPAHRQRLPRHRAGRGCIPSRQARFRQVQPRQFARLAPGQHIAVRFLVILNLTRPMNLLVHIHAVNHLANRSRSGWPGPSQTG
jgi:hypothetical protein